MRFECERGHFLGVDSNNKKGFNSAKAIETLSFFMVPGTGVEPVRSRIEGF